MCVEGYRMREELEKQADPQKNSRCLYAGWGMRFLISASIRGNREGVAENI